jgi:hypothetical protein
MAGVVTAMQGQVPSYISICGSAGGCRRPIGRPRYAWEEDGWRGAPGGEAGHVHSFPDGRPAVSARAPPRPGLSTDRSIELACMCLSSPPCAPRLRAHTGPCMELEASCRPASASISAWFVLLKADSRQVCEYICDGLIYPCKYLLRLLFCIFLSVSGRWMVLCHKAEFQCYLQLRLRFVDLYPQLIMVTVRFFHFDQSTAGREAHI